MLAFRKDFRGVVDAPTGAEPGDMEQPLDPGFELNEGTEGHELGDDALAAPTLDVGRAIDQAFPRILLRVPQTEANPLILPVQFGDTDLDCLAGRQDVLRLEAAAPAQFAHVDQPFDPGADVGKVAKGHEASDDAIDQRALGEGRPHGLTLLGLFLFQAAPTAEHEVATAGLVVFRDDEGETLAEVGRGVAAVDVHLGVGAEAALAGNLDFVAALAFGHDAAFHGNPRLVRLHERGIGHGAADARRQAHAVVRVADAEGLDDIADLDLHLALVIAEFGAIDQRVAARPDVHKHAVAVDGSDRALHPVADLEVGLQLR